MEKRKWVCTFSFIMNYIKTPDWHYFKPFYLNLKDLWPSCAVCLSVRIQMHDPGSHLAPV